MKLFYTLTLVIISFTFECFATKDKVLIRQLEKQFDYNYALKYLDSVILYTEAEYGINHINYKELLYEKIVIHEAFNKNKEALEAIKKLKSVHLPPYLEGKLEIQLSLIYEKINFFDDCFIALNKAKKIIDEHNLNNLKPFYYLRKSSAHRVNNEYSEALISIDSAVYYGNKFDDFERLAHIYLVKAYLEKTYLSQDKESIISMKIASKYALEVQDIKIGLMTNNFILNQYLNLNLIDSSLIYARKCFHILENNSKYDIFPFLYSDVSLVFQKAEKQDSALYIKKRGELANINIKRLNTQAEIATLVKHFQNDIHTVEINKHQKKLVTQSFELKRLYILSSVLALLVLFTFYQYIRTKKLLKKNLIQQEEIKRINKTLKQSLEKELFLIKELHHRVKNNLQIIIGLLDLQDEDYIEVNAISKQIFSIAAGHELLYQKGLEDSVSIKHYLNELVNYIISSGSNNQNTNVQINTEDDLINLDSIIPIGLMINELLSNSLKHSKNAKNDLKITIVLSIKNSEIKLTYKDNGEAFEISKPKFGTLVIQAMVQQLRGSMHLKTTHGAHYEFLLYL